MKPSKQLLDADKRVRDILSTRDALQVAITQNAKLQKEALEKYQHAFDALGDAGMAKALDGAADASMDHSAVDDARRAVDMLRATESSFRKRMRGLDEEIIRADAELSVRREEFAQAAMSEFQQEYLAALKPVLRLVSLGRHLGNSVGAALPGLPEEFRDPVGAQMLEIPTDLDRQGKALCESAASFRDTAHQARMWLNDIRERERALAEERSRQILANRPQFSSANQPGVGGNHNLADAPDYRQAREDARNRKLNTDLPAAWTGDRVVI